MERPDGRRVEVQEGVLKLRYPKLPSNIYSYRASIFGIPLKDALVMCTIASISILATRIEIFIPLVSSIFLPVFLLYRRNTGRKTGRERKIRMGGRKLNLFLHISIKNYNAQTYVITGKQVSLFYEIQGINILAMRVNVQRTISERLRAAIEDSGIEMDFYSVHKSSQGKSRIAVSYRTYVRFSILVKDQELERDFMQVSNAAQSFQSELQIMGFHMRELKGGTEIEGVLDALLSKEWQGNVKNEGGKDSHRSEFSYFRHRNYTKSHQYFTDLSVSNLEYSLGPYYLTLLEGTGIPVDIHTSLRKVEDRNPAKFLKRLLSERKAELKLSGTSVTGNESLKKQISDLEKLLYQYENEGVQPVNVSITFRVYADHPALLNQNVQRIKAELEMLGISLVQVPSSRNTILDFIQPKPRRRHEYLMNTRQASSMIPIFRDPFDNPGGFVLGIDDLTERFVYFDVFSQNSYNMLVVGETGSGKSYFGKLLLTRSIKFGIAEKALIFDPLNEYFCSFFGSNCVETDMRDFVTGKSLEDEFEKQSFDKGASREVHIIKCKPEDLEDENLINGLLKGLNSRMVSQPECKKLIAIDECHIILKSQRNSKILNQMVRHSRHYNTGIVNISQNTDDFLNERTNSIAFNSSRIFIFRTRNLKESHRKILKLDDFDFESPERLMGGKIHPYSECLMTDGDLCRKLRVISTEEEDSVLHLL